MKKYVLHISIFVFLIVAIISIKCSLDEIDLTPPPDDNIGETLTIHVKEYKSNLPVSGAKFITTYCKEYDFEFGSCIKEASLSSCTTNNDGICNCAFPERAFEDIIIEKSNYWPKHYHQIQPNNEYAIQPAAWITINFSTDAEYPETSQFFIRINGELQSIPTSFPAVNNSSKVLTLFGNEENNMVWELHETFNTTSQLLNSGTFTLNPQKFENMTYTLHY